jgi:sulfonate transport system substrate-binding protein
MDLKNEIIITGLFFILASPWAYAESQSPLKEDATVRIGISKQLDSSIALVAAKKNFFSDEGLSVEIHYDISGKQVLDSLADAGLDIVMGASEVPWVIRSFEKRDFTILAALGGDDISRKIIASGKSGIAQPKDLAGKRIATQENSTAQFFLHIFLNAVGLSEKDVALSFMQAEELPRALSEGRIDAFSMREPFFSQAQTLLGKDAVVFELPHIYFSYSLVVTRTAYIKAHPGALRKIFRALKKAEDFSLADPDGAADITAAFLEIKKEKVRQGSQDRKQEIFLDHGLFAILEDVARWAIQSGRVPHQKIPNYETRIDRTFIEEIKPDTEGF